MTAGQTRSTKDTAKHLIRFRHRGEEALDFSKNVGGLFPELVVANSHNASSSFLMQAGLFRVVCGNGLIVSAATFAKVQLVHTNLDMHTILEGASRILQAIPQIQSGVERFRSISLGRQERLFLAESASRLRWGPNAPLRSSDLLGTRRYEDNPESLWGTYNILQEHLTKGGLRGVASTGRRIRTQAIRSIDNNLALNEGLWDAASWMADSLEMGRSRWELPSEQVVDLEKEE